MKDAASSRGRRIAVLLSRFPKPSETFIERELVGLLRAGVDLTLLPLRRQPARSLEGSAQELEPCVRRVAAGSPAVIAAHLRFMLRRPRAYLRAWRSIPRCHPGRPRDAFNFVGRFVKTVYFADLCLREGIDHVHAQWATHPTTAAWMIRLLTDLPYSFTAHAFDIFVHQAFLREKIEAARFVVTCTEKNAEFLRALGAATPVHVVRHGLPLARYRPTGPRAAGYRVLSTARLVPKKGLPTLLRACAELVAAGAPLECRILGDGPLRGELESLASRLGLGDRVSFPGFVAQSEVIEHLRWASMVVLPSVEQPSGDRDGVPNALVEALAMAVPVVSTAVSAIPELVADGREGLLVPPDDPGALADAMRRIGESAELGQRLGRCGRERVLSGYDLGRTTARMVELLDPAPPRGRGVYSRP